MKSITHLLQVFVIMGCLLTAAIAQKPDKAAPMTTSETLAKINEKCDFKIVDATATDVLEFVSKATVPIDFSEVEPVLKNKSIRLTLQANKWADIVTNAADQIGASILIRHGSIKLVPAKQEEAAPQAEQIGTGQPATRPVVEPEGGDEPQLEAEGRSR